MEIHTEISFFIYLFFVHCTVAELVGLHLIMIRYGWHALLPDKWALLHDNAIPLYWNFGTYCNEDFMHVQDQLNHSEGRKQYCPETGQIFLECQVSSAVPSGHTVSVISVVGQLEQLSVTYCLISIAQLNPFCIDIFSEEDFRQLVCY